VYFAHTNTPTPEQAMPTSTTYEAKVDNVGAFIPLHQRRRALVIKYHRGKFAYVCGRFSTLQAAAKRAAELNASEVAGKVTFDHSAGVYEAWADADCQQSLGAFDTYAAARAALAQEG
jgi:hypothetical protein